jgi:hypothetical protein
MDLMADIFIRILAAARLLVGAAFVLGLAVAVTHWLVREQKIAAFGGWPASSGAGATRCSSRSSASWWEPAAIRSMPRGGCWAQWW